MTVPAEMLANVVQALQADPLYYRHFGPAWWRVKRMLKAAGYTREVLHHLGDDFPDPPAEHRWDGLTDSEFLRQVAFPTQLANAQLNWHGQQTDDDGPDETDVYWIHDPDVEV